jgi:hypothetical protein
VRAAGEQNVRPQPDAVGWNDAEHSGKESQLSIDWLLAMARDLGASGLMTNVS